MTTEIAPLASLDDLRSSLAHAASELARGLDQLDQRQRYAPRPETYSTEAAYLAEQAAYLPGLEQAEQTALAISQRIAATARAALDQAEAGFVTFTPSEEQRAAALRPEIREDVEHLSWAQLLSRIRQAALSADRVSQALLVRYGKMRLAHTGLGAGLEPAEDDARHSVATSLDVLEGRLIPDAVAQVRERALGVLEASRRLEDRASARRRANQRFTFQGKNDVEW